MRRSVKILSVFMAVVMVFTCVHTSVFAKDRDTSSLNAYLDNENIANVAEALLKDIGAKKEKIVPPVLKIIFLAVDALNERVDDVMSAGTETLAKEFLNYLDEVIDEADLNSKIDIDVTPGVSLKSIVKLLGISDLDLSSIDSMIGVIVDVGDLVKSPNLAAIIAGFSNFGEVKNLDVSMFKKTVNKKTVPLSRGNSTALEIVYALFSFLSNSSNIIIIKSFIKGKLDLGAANNALIRHADIDAEAEIKNLMKDIDKKVNELIYDNLIASEGAKAYADSDYYIFTSDELLAAALIKNITQKDAVTRNEAREVLGLTLNQLIGRYGDGLIAQYAVPALNTTVKEALADLIGLDPQLEILKDIINLDYEFTGDTFNFANMSKEGLFENLNKIVCKIIEVIVQPDVYKRLGLKEGGNENINDNLKAFFSFVLGVLAENNGGNLHFTVDDVEYNFDFSKFTGDYLKGMSLEDMVVAVLKLFFGTLFDFVSDTVLADVDTLEELAGYAAYLAIDQYMVRDDNVDFSVDYKNLVFGSDGMLKKADDSQWYDIIGTMGMQVAVYWLGTVTDIGITQADYKKYPTWEKLFEAVVDWALDCIDGIPAVADEFDKNDYDYGVWYKLNVVLNELIPFGFLNGCGDETFVYLDTYTLIMKKAVPALFDCDFSDFTHILDSNKNTDNPLNKPVISAVLSTADNLLFSLFEHTHGASRSFTKPQTDTRNGYSGKYCAGNGHYMRGTVSEVKAGTVPTPPTTNPPASPKYTLGDVNSDGRITASDARLALRISAGLEKNATETMKLAADVNKDGYVKASDARKILRVSANLEKF